MAHGELLHPTPAYQAFRILQVGFAAAPIIAGVDKFMHLLVDWHTYLSPMVVAIVPAPTLMYIVGAIEIVAGILVAVRPRIGGYLVSAWLLAIVANLLSIPGYFDIALRDFGLAIGAFALARLATAFEA